MLYGNTKQQQTITQIITDMLTDTHTNVYPFIIITGPDHIGKSAFVLQLINNLNTINTHDIAHFKDLSDQRQILKESNDLAGTYHSIQIEVESKRSDITISKNQYIHNRSIRELQDRLVRSPLGSDKVVIIEALERATEGASNALLKTLEEPLPNRLIIATSNNPAQLSPTIMSRAMIFQFHDLADTDMQSWIQQRGVAHGISSELYEDIIALAQGRPGIIIQHQQNNTLEDLLHTRTKTKSLLSQKIIAPLYQHMMTAHKAGYADIIIQGLANTSPTLYQPSISLLQQKSANISMDNLLFQWTIEAVI